MSSPKSNSSSRSGTFRKNLPYLGSPKNSKFPIVSLTYNHYQRADQIIQHQKSIVKENIDRLKNLLSQKRQFNRRNRQDLSPQMIYKSPLRDKENVCTPQKSQPRTNTVNYQPKSQQSIHGGFLGRTQNQNLIKDIKKKIRGSPLNFHERLAEGHFTKNIISPRSFTLYTDNQIDVNQCVRQLIEQNQTLQTQIIQKNYEIERQNQLINQLEQKLQDFVSAAQKQEEKIHSILFQKDGQIQCLKLQKEQQIIKIKSEIQNTKKTLIEQSCSFQSAYFTRVEDFIRIVSKKLFAHMQKLQDIKSFKLLKLKKQIKLQRSIFIPQKSYRKSKNILQMSPSIKGDSLSQHEQLQLNMETEMLEFETEIQYKKDKYKEIISQYEQKYKELEEKFLETLQKNQSLKNDIQLLKQDQTNFLKQYHERIQRKKQFQKQHNLSELDQTLPKGTPNSVNVQASKKNFFFKKQQNVIKIQQRDFMTPKYHQRVDKQVFYNSLINQSSESLYQKQCLSLKPRNQESQKDQIRYFDDISRISSKKDKMLDMNELEERVELELKQKMSEIRKKQKGNINVKITQKEFELQHKETLFAERVASKEKQLELREAKLQEQSKLQQLYIQEMENIKTMVKLMEEADLKAKPQGEQSKIEQPVSHQPKSNIPKKLKQISKVQYLAKMQRKEKEIAKTKLQIMERQLMLQKSKNLQLQNLIVQNEKNLFGKVREIASRKDSSKLQPNSDSQSVIDQEQSPFSTRLQALSKPPKTIEQSKKSAEWQHRVKMRLEEAITRLGQLQEKYVQKK